MSSATCRAAEASEGRAFQYVRKACRGADAGAAYRAISNWIARSEQTDPARTLLELALVRNDDGLARHARELQAALVGANDGKWDGQGLLRALQRVRKQAVDSTTRPAGIGPLNPATHGR